MADGGNLVASVQLKERQLVEDAIRHLEEQGIAASSVPVADVPADELPEWADAEAGGWLLLMDESAWEEGMNALGAFMDYEPEWSPEDMAIPTRSRRVGQPPPEEPALRTPHSWACAGRGSRRGCWPCR